MEQSMNNARQADEIRRLNDELRRNGRGGKVVITSGIGALSVPDVDAIFKAIGSFDLFTPGNDPFGEHDCAVMTVGECRLIWKIDYYDCSRRYGSPDPADPKVTFRVMTVMLSDEY